MVCLTLSLCHQIWQVCGISALWSGAVTPPATAMNMPEPSTHVARPPAIPTPRHGESSIPPRRLQGLLMNGTGAGAAGVRMTRQEEERGRMRPPAPSNSRATPQSECSEVMPDHASLTEMICHGPPHALRLQGSRLGGGFLGVRWTLQALTRRSPNLQLPRWFLGVSRDPAQLCLRPLMRLPLRRQPSEIGMAHRRSAVVMCRRPTA